MNTVELAGSGATASAVPSAATGLSEKQVRHWRDRMGVGDDPTRFARASHIDQAVSTDGNQTPALVDVIGRPDPDDYAEIVYSRQLSVLGVFAALRTPATAERTPSLIRRAPERAILVCSQLSAGGGHLDLDGRRHEFQHPSDLLVLDYSTPFRLSTDAVTDPVGIWVPAEVLGRDGDCIQHEIESVQSSPLARATGAFIVTLAVTAAVRGADIDTETELAAVDLVRDLLGATGGTPPRSTGNGVIVREAARALIRRNFRDPDYSPDHIATALYMSRRNLYRRLAEAGSSPAALIAEQRLERARHLLGSTRAPMIDHVAKSAGFSSPATLRRHFRAKYGVSPERYRRDHRLDDAAASAGDGS
ncbi:MAG: AraC family transcriptional regulator [Gordonia sp.]|uniref:helix-turn-helix domain-containing protein n=1 Tax=Gordonia sp. (in: high G+C Gram-positive bacteria) TaxID=84139 RepID=UPI000C4F0382|nr:AraC family transcriptional regulator [Gordonia sp. (in: high G+C Gram-positive bacteria)]MAU81774.1 AraC family transcriptional regulator [Gordonia sp. (in: high G+C Gram-positive bacteria)]